MIPLLPGGLGAVDGMMILFYSSAGITASISAAATVVERLISFWMTTFLGLLVLPFYGTSVLDKSFELKESEDANNDISDEERKILEQLSEEDEFAKDILYAEKEKAEEKGSKDSKDEPHLEVLDDEEEAVLEVLDDEEELLKEEIKN